MSILFLVYFQYFFSIFSILFLFRNLQSKFSILLY
nr:MAG TPA: hypothetical protein [Caudoviricetes sp.]